MLALLPLCILGCGDRGSSGGGYFGTTERPGKSPHTFYVNNNSEAEYLDPGLTSESAGTTLVNDLFEGLAVLHPDDQRPTQAVATHWDQTEDNAHFRFYLREEAKWSDGKPLTAHDFVWSWQRVLTAATGARTATLMYPIKNGKLFHQGKLKRAGDKLYVIMTSENVTITGKPLSEQLADQNHELSQKGKDLGAAKVLSLGDKTKCNDNDDHYFEVEHNGAKGFLPGCALKQDKKSARVLVQTFDEDKTARFMPAGDLKSDPSVVGVKALDDHTLDVELEKPTPYFIELVSFATYYPVRKDIIDKFGDAWTRPENMVNNGPFIQKEHRFRYDMRLERNPHHYDHDKIKLHEVVLFMVPDYNATVRFYESGELDFIGQNTSLPTTHMDMLSKFDDFTRSDWLATYWYEFNVDKPPVDNVDVRRALNLAIDKRQLIDKVTRGGQRPATHYVPNFTGSGYTRAVEKEVAAGGDRFAGKGHDFDPALAREMFAKAGYEVDQRNGEWHCKDFPALEILYNTSEGHRKIAVAVQDMWKRHLGISVTLRNEEWKVMLKNLRDGHYQVARFGWVADYNHPHTWLDIFLSYSHGNWTNWADPKYDALVERAAATADPVRSIELYRDAEMRAIEGMARMPLYFYTKSTLIKPYVKGFYSNATNRHNLRWMWIDPDWKKNKENVPSYPPREFPEPGTL